MTNFSGYYFRHYYLQKRIGSGGYADVYKAIDIFLDRYVAIKVLKVRVNLNDLQAILQNAREARIAANLIHPHIVSVIEFDIHNNIPFIVMEYANNGSLQSIHHIGEPLPWGTIINYVQQVTEALTFIHNHGIVHQDVKPENMLLDDNHEILISDFGTVAFIQNTGSEFVQEFIGTPSYMAPERFTNDAPTPASDIYSLAVVVFEWLTGKPLFSGSTSAIIRQHRFVIPSTKRMTTLGINPAIQRVLLKALAKNPLDRYQSTAEFYAALESAGRVPEQQITKDKLLDKWVEMSFIFTISIFISLFLGIGLYLAGVKLAIDLLSNQVCLILLPFLSALIRKNWLAIRFALVIAMIAGFIGLLLHSWLSFWWALALSLTVSSIIGLLHGFRN